MKSQSFLRGMIASVAVCFIGAQAWASSDVSNQGAPSATVAASVSSSAAVQTGNIISGAIGGGFSGGGFSSSNQTSDAGTQVGRSAGNDKSGNSVWAQGDASVVHKYEDSLRLHGTIYSGVVGFGHEFLDRYTVGLAADYESVSLKTAYNNGKSDETGSSLIPYVAVKLTPSVTWDLAGGYSWLDYKTDRQNGAVKGDYSANRWFGSTNLVGAYSLGDFRFQPRAGVSFSSERHDGYRETGSSTSYIGADTSNSGIATMGTKIGYPIGNGTPYVKVMGEWDFVTSESVLKANRQMSDKDRLGAVVGLGYEYSFNGVTASLELNDNAVFRQNLDAYTATARLRWQF